MTVQVRRLPIHLLPDSIRVITRYFGLGEVNRIRDVIGRILAIPEPTVETLLANLKRDFEPVHPEICDVFLEHYETVKHHVSLDAPISDARRRLIGACFTMEYAIESAALFNPSMVPAIDQANVPPGSIRFLMSLRATGEGHISSIVFRRGLIDANGNVSVDAPGRYSRTLKASVPGHFEKADFVSRLQSLHAWTGHAEATLALLGDQFTAAELSEAIDKVRESADVPGESELCNDALLALSQANYRLAIPKGADIAELVIFPYSDNERRGIEDLRLVRFTGDDGSFRYYGTYTAYNGFHIFPHLLAYSGGQSVEIHMLNGRCATNKGMALFPRMIRGRYAMIARLDNENLYYLESQNVGVWNEACLLLAPKYPWEVIQIGNCGPPIETDAGWLLLTHGVGPMRQYCIGATLLDRDNPCRALGQTSQPLLVPTGTERFGYVPNVVYSCGGMVHQGKLVLPYAASDFATSIAVIELKELLAALVPTPAGH
jgi:predicted GH43/DUF377 family glycosyl hydrolase